MVKTFSSETKKYFGAHISAAGGVENCPQRAYEIGANTFALFTKNQRQWIAKPLTEESITAFKQQCDHFGFERDKLLPHDSYLINLGNPEKEKREKSINAFIDEMERCNQLDLTLLNFHPGSHLNQISEQSCLSLIAESINIAHQAVPNVVAVIENTAGQGTNLGWHFDQLAQIIDQVDDKDRVGVCLDTCHLFAAGYDLRTYESCELVFSDFERSVGLHYLRAMHLNDSKVPLGKRVDRHDSLGSGHIGWDAFSYIASDPRFVNIPMILETIRPELWAQEIATLKEFELSRKKTVIHS